MIDKKIDAHDLMAARTNAVKRVIDNSFFELARSASAQRVQLSMPPSSRMGVLFWSFVKKAFQRQKAGFFTNFVRLLFSFWH
jgi:hypothetical protein